MNSIISKVAIFAIGAAAGSIATYKLAREKYEQAVKEWVEELNLEITDILGSSTDEKDSSNCEREEYTSKISELNYDRCKEEESMNNTPYIIPPEEFGMLDDYDTVSLNYFKAKDILTDDWDNPIENVEALVGKGFEEHFGEYEDDAVFIRNDRTETDYEILLDPRGCTDNK